MRVAATMANKAASNHSRQTGFFFLFLVVVSVVVSVFFNKAMRRVLLVKYIRFKSNNFPYKLLYEHVGKMNI